MKAGDSQASTSAQRAWSLEEARNWCRRYALSHYENFAVASVFLTRAKRDEYYALYAFARGADDRADEIALNESGEGAATARLEALNEWQGYLDTVYSGGTPPHPAFVALRPVIERHGIEKELFDAMMDAFRRDQSTTRYETWEDVRGYTSGSADPVGRWVLRLHGHRSEELDRLSDSICTGLQLVNFMQDIRSDLRERNRVYLPQSDLSRFGVNELLLGEAPTPHPVRELLKFEEQRAEALFCEGRPLIKAVRPSLARQLILFHGGGRLALEAIRRAGYDVGSRHARVTRWRKSALLVRAIRGVPL